MKNIQEYLRSDTKQSSMRLMAIRAVNTACFIAVVAVLGAVSGVIVAIALDRGLSVISGIVGGLLGGSAGIVGTLLVPAFAGKSSQSFAETKKTPEEEK